MLVRFLFPAAIATREGASISYKYKPKSFRFYNTVLDLTRNLTKNTIDLNFKF